MTKKEKVKKIYNILIKEYPEPKTALKYRTPFEILTATILSAQCTDVRVNIVTKELFKKYKKIKDYANADLNKFQEEIKSTGFYKNKSKNIINSAKVILKNFEGKVPDNMEELLTLPGVARKTANVVLGAAFKKTEGIVVDTHVKRLSFRIGLTKQTNPEKIEKDLMKIFEKRFWINLAFLLINHGRKICIARKPLCDECSISSYCIRNGVKN